MFRAPPATHKHTNTVTYDDRLRAFVLITCPLGARMGHTIQACVFDGEKPFRLSENYTAGDMMHANYRMILK
jgi:hypothetical protein